MTYAHLSLLLRLHPQGVLDLDDSTAREDLAVLGYAFDQVWLQRDELIDEILPDRAGDLLTDWERVYDIHRVGSRTVAQRQARLVAHRRLLPNFTPSTIEDIVETLTGIDVDLVEPGAFRCDDPDSLTDTPADVLDGAFVFCITLNEATARSEGLDRDEIDEILERVKPAHVYGLVRCDDFRADDEWSLTDRDLLAS